MEPLTRPPVPHKIQQEALAEYLDRGHLSQGTGRFVCKVIHAGGRPILKLPDRNNSTDVPSDWVDILVAGQPRVANFVKEYVNVIRADRNSTQNLLADIVRDWFSPDAGRPGTGYQVAFERQGDRWRMEPMKTP